MQHFFSPTPHQRFIPGQRFSARKNTIRTQARTELLILYHRHFTARFWSVGGWRGGHHELVIIFGCFCFCICMFPFCCVNIVNKNNRLKEKSVIYCSVCLRRFLELQFPQRSKALRTGAFVVPFIFDTIPLFYRVSVSAQACFDITHIKTLDLLSAHMHYSLELAAFASTVNYCLLQKPQHCYDYVSAQS